MKAFTAGDDAAAQRLWLRLSLCRRADPRRGAHARSPIGRARRARAGRAGPSPTTTRRASRRAGATRRGGRRSSAMALMLLVALRGNVIIYQGEELGLPQARRPVRALHDPEAHRQLAADPGPRRRAHADAVDRAIPMAGSAARRRGCRSTRATSRTMSRRRSRTQGSVLHWTRRMIALRRGSEALRLGTIELIDHGSDQIVAFDARASRRTPACACSTCPTAPAQFGRNGRARSSPVAAGPIRPCQRLPPASGYIARC